MQRAERIRFCSSALDWSGGRKHNCYFDTQLLSYSSDSLCHQKVHEMLHEMKTLSRGELPTDSLPCHKRCRLPQDDSLGTFSLSGLGKKAESKTSNSTQTTVCPFFLVARLSISTVLSPVLSEGEESPFADSCSSLSFAQRVGCYPEKVFVLLLSERGKRMERAGARSGEAGKQDISIDPQRGRSLARALRSLTYFPCVCVDSRALPPSIFIH